MSRKLFITSEISVDERLTEVAETSPEAALLWPWLLTALDDWGRSTAEPKRLKYAVFPAFACVTPQTVSEALRLFAQVRLITLYEVEGKPYFAVPTETWFKYQTHIRTEKRESDKSRYPAPPCTPPSQCAQVREDARDCAHLRAGAVNPQPSPSPSPSPSLSPSYPDEREPSDAAASHAGAHTREKQPEPSSVQPAQSDNSDGNALILETEATLARWRTLSTKRRARLPSPEALHDVLRKHAHRGMSASDLRTELRKLEDEVVAAASGRQLTLTRLDNWLNQWHAPPPAPPVASDRSDRPGGGSGRHVGGSRRGGPPEPPPMVSATPTSDWWITPLTKHDGDAPTPNAVDTAIGGDTTAAVAPAPGAQSGRPTLHVIAASG